ncbi:hypothetical protein [Paenibacillus sp. MMS18-CY102]|nr:hypothetical protein [Paenibacillus sp. MMS18-CY102]MWC30450.1 hypothetical protein [Paenibacillus sp. MMS18-CY102]
MASLVALEQAGMSRIEAEIFTIQKKRLQLLDFQDALSPDDIVEKVQLKK